MGRVCRTGDGDISPPGSGLKGPRPYWRRVWAFPTADQFFKKGDPEGAFIFPRARGKKKVREKGMEIVEKTLSEIQPYEKNPRKNDAAVQYVEASIREFGFRIPIIIDKNGVIVCGHTRYKAARKMKLEKVPCIYADDLTEEQIRAFRIADNKTGEAASWDWSILPEELKGIKTIDMTAFGFLNTEVEDPNDVHEDNYNPEGAKRRTAAGQLWELGEHRLMIGDSTDPAAVKNLMGGGAGGICFHGSAVRRRDRRQKQDPQQDRTRRETAGKHRRRYAGSR